MFSENVGFNKKICSLTLVKLQTCIKLNIQAQHPLLLHFANHLRHRPHRAEGTPGSRLEQCHHHQA